MTFKISIWDHDSWLGLSMQLLITEGDSRTQTFWANRGWLADYSVGNIIFDPVVDLKEVVTWRDMNIQARTIFTQFQNAGWQGATRESIPKPSIVCGYIRTYPGIEPNHWPWTHVFLLNLYCLTVLLWQKLNISASSHRKEIICLDLKLFEFCLWSTFTHSGGSKAKRYMRHVTASSQSQTGSKIISSPLRQKIGGRIGTVLFA